MAPPQGSIANGNDGNIPDIHHAITIHITLHLNLDGSINIGATCISLSPARAIVLVNAHGGVLLILNLLMEKMFVMFQWQQADVA